MEPIAALAEIVAEVVGSYACPSPNSTMYHLHDVALGMDAVVVVPHKRQRTPYLVVMTRTNGDAVHIELDATDHPIEEALIRAGISRARIVLAHRGEGLSVS
jgi:hypothetical protein